MINVTKTFLPPQKEYNALLQRVWKTGWVTNRGILVNELEDRLINHLNIDAMICMANGTLPLQIAIKALHISGEIITTPFSYVATTSSIVWEGCTPVFVDIHPEFLTIDETKIEASITENTTAILATHVFGNPCNIEEIERLANKYNLKVIYDAAHCFGVTYKNKSIFSYGDVSTCSFHATKLFHTGEGGALFCNSDLKLSMFRHHNFGHEGHENFDGIGINAKMSELQAAMGLAVLPYIEKILKSRKEIVERYTEAFSILKTIKIRPQTKWNYSYFPLLFNDEAQLLKVKKALNEKGIFPRRYFYPSLNTLDYVNSQPMPISEGISKRVLCLPLYLELTKLEQELIINCINKTK